MIGGALLATAELGYWSFELEAVSMQTRPGILRRAATIVVLVVLGVGLSAALTTVLS